MTRNEAVHALVELMRAGDRTDRYLQVTEDGEYYLTDARSYMGPDGRYVEPAVEVPYLGKGLSAIELERAAEGLVDDLDRLTVDLEEDEEP